LIQKPRQRLPGSIQGSGPDQCAGHQVVGDDEVCGSSTLVTTTLLLGPRALDLIELAIESSFRPTKMTAAVLCG
jgi:hypothetical protein